MNANLKTLLAAVALTTLAACTTTAPDTSAADDAAAQAAAQAQAERERAEAEAIAAREAAEQAERDRIAALLANTTILFDYDQDSIRPEYTEMLQIHASNISAKGAKVTLEGHGDERGTPEYNLALGERRAKSVAQILRTYGVADAQIEVVSFGEESPADDGHSESAWQANRRVEIKYN